jgi:hypothetical protein
MKVKKVTLMAVSACSASAKIETLLTLTQTILRVTSLATPIVLALVWHQSGWLRAYSSLTSMIIVLASLGLRANDLNSDLHPSTRSKPDLEFRTVGQTCSCLASVRMVTSLICSPVAFFPSLLPLPPFWGLFMVAPHF